MCPVTHAHRQAYITVRLFISHSLYSYEAMVADLFKATKARTARPSGRGYLTVRLGSKRERIVTRSSEVIFRVYVFAAFYEAHGSSARHLSHLYPVNSNRPRSTSFDTLLYHIEL